MTKHPGVERVGPRLYRVRAKWRCQKTGRRRELVRIVEADSQADAAAMRIALKAAQSRRREAPPRQRVGDCALSWLRSKHGEVKPSTAKLYADILEAYVLPMLGDYYMDAVTRADVLEWRDAQKGKPVSINGRLRVMRTFFGEVCRDMGIPNPTERVARLRELNVGLEDDDRAGSKVLTADELGRLLAAVHDVAPQHYALVLTLATTGARFGEATALRWEDIDEERGVLRIRRAQWRGHVGSTKTNRVRTVALADELAEVLRAHRLERWKNTGGPIGPWVFPSKTGGFAFTTTLRRPLAKAAKAAKLDRTPSAHWFRHTMSDLLRQATTGQVQRSITGHVTEKMAEHYSHVAIGEKKEALGRVLRLVRAAPQETPSPKAEEHEGGGAGGGDEPSTPITDNDLEHEYMAS